MTVAARTRAFPRIPTLPVAVLVACVGAAIVLAWSRSVGAAHYANDPASVVALGAGATVMAILATRAQHTGARRFSAWLAASAVSVASYLALSAAAAWAVQMNSWLGPTLVALWGAAWIPPLLVTQCAVLAAVQRSRSVVSITVAAGTAVVTVASVVLQAPQEPFAGVATIAPGAWVTSHAVFDAVVTGSGGILLLVIPIVLARATVRSTSHARVRFGLAGLASTLPVLVVVVCVLLAIARDPGQVDPTIGSVAFIVVLSTGTTLATCIAALAARGGAGRALLLGVTRSVVGGFAAVAAIAISIVTANAMRDSGLAAAVITCAGVVAAAVIATWAVGARVANFLTPEDAASSQSPRIETLTAREHEVLDLLAEGASNAGIATELVISERTVDAHLRSIFTKLDLDADAGSNRRVVAARLWLEAGQRDPVARESAR